ncbi:transposase [Rhodoferax sp.]|uniref:IS91 family transposase n=1 Tax=Rhodoferax sp. TaxID=50421 RepID=UPI002601BFAD|nr:transposase [Rhodoferax sp.]MDD2810255.1 transposase [Rhodoferax sp.]
MIPLAAIIEQFESAYLTQYATSILPSQRKALDAMKLCRSSLGPGMLAQCDNCAHQRIVPHSCGHRNCPHCQHFESQRWIERQTQALVPGSYFLITFTVPAELRSLVGQHQRLLYKALMDCAWSTLRTFSQNHRQLRGNPGAVAVLHTHSRKLEFHPHVHLAMPAAALDADKKIWRTLRKSKKGDGYLFNHKALARVFCAKFQATLIALGLPLPPVLPKKWVTDCRCVGSGQKALVYLGRYLYRGVIQEKDILRCENGQVTYRWRDSKTKKYEQRTLSGVAFLHLVMQHVLPKGFRRSRNYGFLHHNSKRLMALLQLLVFKRHAPAGTAPAPDAQTEKPPLTERPKLLCRCCGGVMTVMRRRILPIMTASPGARLNSREMMTR